MNSRVPLAPLAAPLVALALGAAAGCRFRADAGALDGGGAADVGGSESDAGAGADGPPHLAAVRALPSGGAVLRVGGYLELSGSGLGADDATLLVDGAPVLARAAGRKACSATAPCWRFYAWSADRVVVAPPITAGSGTVAIAAGTDTSDVLAFTIDERAVPTGEKGDPPSLVAGADEHLVVIRRAGLAKIGVRIVARDGSVESATPEAGQSIAAEPLLLEDGTLAGASLFVASVVAGKTHLFHGPLRGPLTDTGVLLAHQRVPLLGATRRDGQPACWTISDGFAAQIVWREAGVWRSASSSDMSFELGDRANSIQVAADGAGTHVHAAVGLNRGVTNYVYDLVHFDLDLDEAGAVRVGRYDKLEIGRDDFLDRLAVAATGGSARIHHVNRVATDGSERLVTWDVAASGTPVRSESPDLPVFFTRSPDGLRAVRAPWTTGPFGPERRVRVGDGESAPASGDLAPIFQDPLAVAWLGATPTWLVRDRDLDVPPLESGKMRWIVPR